MRLDFKVMHSVNQSSENVSTPPFELRNGSVADAPVRAELMYTEIPWGRLRDFGIAFLTVLNRAFCTSRHAVCIVAVVDGRVVGYVAGVTHLGRFYKEFLLRYGVAAAFAIL